MNSERFLPLRFAEALLGYFGSSHAEFTRPNDVDLNLEVGSSVDSASRIPCRLFENLLSEEIALENDFLESGYAPFTGFHYGFVFVPDNDGDIVCKEGAVIPDREAGSFVIELDRPVIFRLVGGDAERSLTDRIRVVAYLVCLGCQCVGISRSFVGFLGEGVCVLRELVRLARLENGNDGGDEPHAAETIEQISVQFISQIYRDCIILHSRRSRDHE